MTSDGRQQVQLGREVHQMKTTVRSLFLAFLMVAFMSTMVFAAMGGNENAVWDGEEATYGDVITNPDTGDYGDARAFIRGGAYQECNKDFSVDFTTKAHVAQWGKFNLTSTMWEWYVRKPGTYFTDCITVTVQSNSDISITGEGFGNLLYGDVSEYPDNHPQGSVNPEIATWYAGKTTGMMPTPGEWVEASALNEGITIADSLDLHEGLVYKLWNKIQVVECNTASTYVNTGTITFALANQKDFIVDGEWWDLVERP